VKNERALRFLIFLKHKWDGSIKARGFADGRPQREYMTKRKKHAHPKYH